jgi:hypothetical protein
MPITETFAEPGSIKVDYSDLGDVSNFTKNVWQDQQSRYSTYEYYYSGRVFEETVDDGEIENPPKAYPVGINVVKMMCQSLADATFGEWDHLPLWFSTRQGVDENDDTLAAAQLLSKILFNSNAESMFLEMELHRMLYGASVLKIRADLRDKGAQWLAINPKAFFPVFDPHNKNRLLEAKIVTYITKEQAEAYYRRKFSTDEVLFEEYWNLDEHWVKLDNDVKIPKFSGRNPYGVVPFVYIPRMRSMSVWGDSIADDIIPVQDELNSRVADVGDAININAHPIRWGLNLPQGFNTKNFPIGSDSLWNLGRSFGEHKPEVGVLELDNPIPQGTFDNIKWLYDWVRTSTFAPPIAFGEDNGGGQRSGATLEIRMLPLIKSVRKHRAYLRTALRQAAHITGKILKQKNYSRVRVRETLINGDLEASFADILPRDRAAIVDEVVKRFATNPISISLETALKKLGADSVEMDRIEETIKAYGLDRQEQPEQTPDEKESDTD